MNASSFDRILRQVFLLPLLALLLAAGAMAWQMREAAQTVNSIESTDETIARTERLTGLIADQETGLRGYQTTRDPQFLEPYLRAGIQIPNELELLRKSDADAGSTRAVNDLESAHDTWQKGFAEPVIATIQAGGQTSDVELNLVGKREMDAIRGRMASLGATARASRQASIQRSRRQVRDLLTALVVAALLIGLIIGFYTRRQLQDVSFAFRKSHNILRLRAEQTFRSEQKLRTTLQSIGDGVITCDAEGCVDSLNDVAEQLTGWTVKQAHGAPLEQVFHIINEATRQPLENPVSKVKRLNSFVGLANHTILVRKDSSEIFIEDSGAPIRDKPGNLIGIVLVFRDVTMAKKSREVLMANEKLAVAGRLAATIAHEIHNPLDSVSNLLFLMDGQSTPEESAQFLQLAKQEIARVTQISRAMLSLYRESKAPVAIDVREMLESILLLMDRRFIALAVTIAQDLPEGLVVHGFPAELRQVFTNLLTNAAEATSAQRAAEQGGNEAPPGIVSITARPSPARIDSDGHRREEGVEVSIADKGAGIPREILGSLFRPFFTTKGERGTGLGLWVSRGIITKHGGDIELSSSTDPADRGTTVCVFLATHPVIDASGGD